MSSPRRLSHKLRRELSSQSECLRSVFAVKSAECRRLQRERGRERREHHNDRRDECTSRERSLRSLRRRQTRLASSESGMYFILRVSMWLIERHEQSIAREMGPQGVHVAFVVSSPRHSGARTAQASLRLWQIIDGTILTRRTEKIFGSRPDKEANWMRDEKQRLSPDSIARTYLYLHRQTPDAWTLEMDLRWVIFGSVMGRRADSNLANRRKQTCEGEVLKWSLRSALTVWRLWWCSLL